MSGVVRLRLALCDELDVAEVISSIPRHPSVDEGIGATSTRASGHPRHRVPSALT